MTELAIQIHTEDGQIHEIDAPADMVSQECARELVQGLRLAATDPAGFPIHWQLFDKTTGHMLQPDLTLEQNGVCNGHAFSLRPEKKHAIACLHCGRDAGGGKFCQACGASTASAPAQDIRLHILIDGTRSQSLEVPARMNAAALLKELSANFTLLSDVNDESSASLYLIDQETSTILDLKKNLQENGVRDGHHLDLRPSLVAKPEATAVPEKIKPTPTPTRQRSKVGTVVLIGAGILVFLGIAGFFTFRDRPQPVPMSIAPKASILWGSQQQEFKARLNDENDPAVNWSVEPAIGSISRDGIYTAPPALTSDYTLTITARSKAHPEKSATASIVLKASETRAATPVQSIPIEITLIPSSASLWAREQQRFRVHVSGGSSAVSWTLEPDVGTLSPNGMYTAPYETTARRSVKLTVASKDDPSKSAVAVITLKPSIAGR